MDDSLMHPRFKDRIAKIDNDSTFEMFVREFETNGCSYQNAFTTVANELGVTISEIQYLYDNSDWCGKYLKREAEQAMMEQIVAQKEWKKGKENIRAMGIEAVRRLAEKYEETGELPFDLEKIATNSIDMERFLKAMDTVSNVKLTGDDNFTKAIIINQQHNETNIKNVTGVDKDKINDILSNEGFVKDGEFIVKEKKDEKYV